MNNKALPQQTPQRTPRRSGALRAYRFNLDSGACMVYVGPVRNKTEAERALRKQFGDTLVSLRVHPLFDPWPPSRK